MALKAKEYIEFKEGFAIELGGELSAETEPCFTPILLKDTCTHQQSNALPQYLMKKFFYKREE